MNRLQMREEVRGNIKRKENAFSDEKINTYLNWAQERIADAHTFEEMRTSTEIKTVKGKEKYDFPERMKDVYSLTLVDGSNSRKLEYVHARRFDRIVPNPSTYSNGRPSMYVDYGTSFQLFKIPNKEYKLVLRFSQYPRPLTNDNMESDLVRKDKLIIAGATAFGFWALREIEDAEYWNNIVYAQLLSEAIRTDHSAEDWVPQARGFGITGSMTALGEYWKSPFVRRI